MKKLYKLRSVCFTLFFTILLLSFSNTYCQNLPNEYNAYYLQNVSTNQFLEVDNNELKLFKSTKGHLFNQQFKIKAIETDNTKFWIYPNNSDGEENPPSFSVNVGGVTMNPNGSEIILSDENSKSQTHWLIEPTSGTFNFILRSADSKKVLGLLNESNPKVIQWDLDATKDPRFQWRIIPVITTGTYFLRNRSTKMILDVTAAGIINGSKIGQQAIDDEDDELLTSQKFEIKSMDDFDGSIFSLSPTHSKGTKYLDNRKLDNEQLQIWKSEGEDGHLRWQILDVSDEYETQYVSIRSLNTNRFIGVNSSSDKRVIMRNESSIKGDPRFQWELIYTDEVPYLAEGRYQVVNKATQKVWEVPNASLELNSVLRETSSLEQFNQQFDISINDKGKYIFSPVHARGTRFVVVDGTSPSSNKNGTMLRIWNNTHPASEFDVISSLDNLPSESVDEEDKDGQSFDENELYFSIRSVFSGLDVGVHNHSGKTEIMQWAYNWKNDDRFQWSFEPVYQEEEVTPGKYIIQNVSTDKVFDVAGWGSSAGMKVIQWPYASKTNQQFDIQPNGLGYTLRPLHTSNMYLNVCNCTNQNNSPLTIWSPSWEIERFMFDVVKYDQNGLPLYGIRSLFSNLNIGVHSSDNPNVMQWNVHWGVENDTRFQWRILKVGSPNAREVAMQSPSTELSSLIEPQLEVYPNPAIQDFNIKIGEFSEQDDLSITIADAMGKVLLQKSIGKERELNFNAASLGLKETNYIIHISNGSGKRVSKILRRE